ncbi:MAG: LPS export ABC transporter periplasmic protein LptC [Ignavibacteria bacterium]|nr:LPS export ABC transporter periplasmic protein LptC [Ignavibacteria bacterium]
MNKSIVSLILVFICLQFSALAQNEPITVTGEELIGRVENGMSVREVAGNVVLRQGNVKITCDRAIQYLAQNNAHLIGRVVVTQDTLTIKTPEGFYYGNEKRAYSNKGVTLDDKKVTLSAVQGEYFFKTAKADFTYNVTLKDSSTTLSAQHLLYYRHENRAIANIMVKIVGEDNTIFADSIEHFREAEITFGFGNVSLQNNSDRTILYGQHVADYRKKQYSIVDKDPLLVQVDTSYNDKKDTVISIDTMIIRSQKMEAWRDSSMRFVATDSVRIIRGMFASKNDLSIYRKNAEQIVTYRLKDSTAQPVLWYETTQLTGDSVTVTLRNRQINSAEITVNALIISQNKKFPARFDQVTGQRVLLHFRNSRLHASEFFGNVLSMYYVYDDESPNGIVKASAKNAKIVFSESRVDEVHLFGEPKSEFHPENVVAGKEKTFTLPQFRLVPGRPDKNSIFKNFFNSRFTL